ncbi:MAG: hypothetical protein ABIJ45_05320 [Candidatus Zixiibacteriota bacterium]
MKKWLIILISSMIILPGWLMAESESFNGVQFEITVRQKPVGYDKYFEIVRDTFNVLEGQKSSGFVTNMNLDIELLKMDSQSVTINTFLTTVGKDIYHKSDKYKIEYNLPARFENIPGKKGSVYQLLISPRQRIAIDTSCTYQTGDNQQFTISPSPNFDIHYVPYSLGEFHWTNVRTYLEEDFELFRKAFDIQISNKINVYLVPCPSNSIVWDRRFGYSLTPGRKNVYAIYNHNFASIDAILPNLMILYHSWGYAPPLLAEGIASYFDFPQYKMKKLKNAGEIPSLNDLLTSAGYFSADPSKSEIVAASFCKYLADAYGVNKIKELYNISDDLNIKKNLELLYERPLNDLQTEWLNYVDTLRIKRELYDHYTRKASILYRSNEQIEYLVKMAESDTTRYDSVDTWSKLATVYYQYGEFYKAIDGYKLLMKLDRPTPLFKLILGNLYMINGAYDSAYAILDTVYREDSTRATAKLLQAQIEALRGDTARALEIAESYFPKEQTAGGKTEFLLFLGDILNTPGTYMDTSKAQGYFKDALTWSKDMMTQVPNEPAHKLRAGMACLGLKRYAEAQGYLEVSLFTEKRTYFLARTLLNMGNLFDATGNHDRAIDYYREALELPLADFDRIACLYYIDHPYKN